MTKQDFLIATDKDKIEGFNQLKDDYHIMFERCYNLQTKLEKIKFYIEQSDIKNMLWGKQILKIIGGNDD